MDLRRSTTALLTLLVTAITLTACGAETGDRAGDDPTESPSISSAASTESTTGSTTDSAPLPDCADVWVEGSDLPGSYQGCTADGKDVEPQVIDCESGQRLITFDDHYWAVRGHVIGYAADGLDSSDKYASVLTSCRA